MSNHLREALENGEFVVTCEMIPGRGFAEEVQEKTFEEARQIWNTGRVHAISITDNPGGNPAILADGVGIAALEEGITPLVHFTCKDRNRNQIMAQLYNLQRRGIENVLFMTGDYQVGGWRGRSRPAFDLDSVQIQMLAKEMNDGLVVEGRRGPITEKPTNFFAGGVVNPFKYRAGEIIPQYLKAEKKILAGAQYLICQLGYDTRKLDELKRYLSLRGYTTPLIANVFLLTRGAAKLMRSGAIAGCFVSDELMEVLEREFAESDDKGRGARMERAARMVAIAKGLGYAGVHIGGFGVDATAVNTILDRAAELEDKWEELAVLESYPQPGGNFLFEGASSNALDGTPLANGAGSVVCAFNTDKPIAMDENIEGRKLFEKYRLSRTFHHWMLTLGERGGKVLEAVMDKKEQKHGGPDFPHTLEHVNKAAIYGCIDCGDCGLEACIYSCPMSQCPKCQRNGPCGGSMDGWCEVYPGKRYCIWYMAYHRLQRYDEMWRMTSFITPPNDWDYFKTSAWSNYTHRRDNCAKRIPVDLGLKENGQGEE